MKKIIKKALAVLGSIVLAIVPVLATSSVALSAPKTSNSSVDWSTVDWSTFNLTVDDDGNIDDIYADFIYSGISTDLVFSSETQNVNVIYSEGMYFHYKDIQQTEAYKKYKDLLDNIYSDFYNISSIELFVSVNLKENDTGILYLPFTFSSMVFADCSDSIMAEVNGNVVNITCIEDTEYGFWLDIIGEQAPPADEAVDQFWFNPMKTQLAIAADMAAQNGKETVAEAEGNFGLSYEIMCWLKAHPNVTLKYKLTYKEKEYNLVIPGKSVEPDPEIPWYGPEYLIGKFLK